MATETNEKVTITDIAEAAGVSPAAVSLALRNRPGVSAATRERVQKTAVAMGYLLDASVTNDRKALSSLGVVVKDSDGQIFIDNPFYGRVIVGIEDYCRQEKINLMYAHLSVDEDNNPLDIPRILLEQLVDGLLLVGFWLHETAMRMLRRQEAPIVLEDAYSVDGHDYDAVRTDNLMGGYAATKHLLDLGHEHIALVGSMPQSYPSIQGRRTGYERAMSERRLQPYFVDCHTTAEKATPATRSFLAAHPEVTAAFACNDEVAIAAMRGALDSGRRILDDLSIIGFDEINPSRLITPPLTAMRIDKAKMGVQQHTS